jgi:flavin reductase (DIM6/NTAB) family NADH-FMN oxidoreductase RutF
MKKQVWKGTVLTSPVPPVMVSCGDMESSNIVTVAWTGTVNTKPPMTYISLRPSRHSYGIIKEKGEFVINLTTTDLIKKADYCGIYTGKKVDKFEKCGFTKAAATEVSAPIIDECPVNLECKVKDIIPLGTHDMFLAEIVAVHVDEALIDENGKLHLEKANLSAFAHGDYYSLGKKLAPFGISVKNKKKHTHNKSK